MPDLYCYTLSPIHLSEKKNFIIPPVLYSGRLYIIQDKTLLNILSKIGLIKDYISAIRENGYEYTYKWLKSRKLLNENLLENINRYWIENVDIKNINNCKLFARLDNNSACIDGKYIKNYLKSAIINDFISKRSIEFNIYAETLIDKIEKELSTINNPGLFFKRRKYFESNYFKQLIGEFLGNNPEIEDLEYINSLEIEKSELINDLNFNIYEISELKHFKNAQFQLNKDFKAECLSENSVIKFNTKSIKYNYYLELLIEKASAFSQEKLAFDKEYMETLIDKYYDTYISASKNPKKSFINIIKGIKNFGNLELLTKTQVQETIQSDSECCFSDSFSIKKDYIDKIFNKIKNSNILFFEESELTSILCILNLEKSLLSKLNALFYDKSSVLEANFTKFSSRDGRNPHLPIGYARINCM